MKANRMQLVDLAFILEPEKGKVWAPYDYCHKHRKIQGLFLFRSLCAANQTCCVVSRQVNVIFEGAWNVADMWRVWSPSLRILNLLFKINFVIVILFIMP